MRISVLTLVAITAASLALGGCNTPAKNLIPAPVAAEIADDGFRNSPARYMPRAVAYRTSGNYDDNVPVTLSADGSTLQSFPAPTDVTPEVSTPIRLCDGYLLDRRGISPRSVFTRYTYAEYASLKKVPTTAELLKAVIPGAVVTEIVEFPFTTTEAEADTALCNKLLREHSPELRQMWPR